MHSMIYNTLEDQAVIFGGFYDSFLNDLTVLSLAGQPWWFINPGQGTPPPSRGGHAAVYDRARNRMLVIGGYDGAVLNDVWEYAPAGTGTWRPLAPTDGPFPARAQHAAVFDSVRDRVLVFGGDGGTFLDDVWALNLSGEPSWEQLTPAGPGPTARREHSMIYDPVGDRVLLYGGFDGRRRGDVWALNLSGTPTWSVLVPATLSPPSRFGHAAVYDAAQRRMVVFGGSADPGLLSNAVWALDLDYATPVTVSLAATEVRSDLVRLEWIMGPAQDPRTAVYRTTGDDGVWADIGSPTSAGQDRLILEDRAVVPGTRYGYQLVVWEGSEETRLDPVWVTVPKPAVLSLLGASPNPAVRDLTVAFSLPGDEPASLELYDLRGRRVAHRDVGALGAGDHRVSLTDGRNLPAGVYLVRLTRAERSLTAKACIVR
jgi:hypothetical protein